MKDFESCHRMFISYVIIFDGESGGHRSRVCTAGADTWDTVVTGHPCTPVYQVRAGVRAQPQLWGESPHTDNEYSDDHNNGYRDCPNYYDQHCTNE